MCQGATSVVPKRRKIKRALAPAIRDNAKVQIISRKGQQKQFRWNPQRLYARLQIIYLEKIESDLHGDMQKPAEMSGSRSNAK